MNQETEPGLPTVVERLERCMGGNHADAVEYIRRLERFLDDSDTYVAYLEQILKDNGITP